MSLLHQIALSCIPGIGPVLARGLLNHCGDAESVFKLKPSQLSAVPGLGVKSLRNLKSSEIFRRAEKEIRFIDRYRIKPLFVNDEAYPQRLRNCTDAPIMLYFKGNTSLNGNRSVSIVGARNASEYGRELCRSIIAELKLFEPMIVSGLAYGIDAAAHRESLKHGIPTIGVLAHGLDRIYPATHRSMAERMLDCGGLVTEFLSETVPDRENFPKRNRIIAGMSDITLVVEASIKGGALITAELANAYNREVFAFPGRINDEQSAGCNYLIKTHRANLITRVSDIEYIAGWVESKVREVRQQMTLLIDLTLDEQHIADKLKLKINTGIDELAYLTNFPPSTLAVILLEMEMKGLVVSLPGKLYKLA